MLREINKIIQNKSLAVIETAKQLKAFENDQKRLPHKCLPLVKKLLTDAQSLYSAAVKYGTWLEPDDSGAGVDILPLEPCAEASVIRSISVFDDGGIRLCLENVPSKNAPAAARYGRLLRSSLSGLSAEERDKILAFEEVDIAITRKTPPEKIDRTYDVDNGGYTILLNALQGTLLRSERMEYIRSLAITGEASCENLVEIDIRQHKSKN